MVLTLLKGNADLTKIDPPLKDHGGQDGIAQMQHFVNDDKFNAFRLPVAWQYLVNNQVGGPLDPTNSAIFDELVQGCLATGALCIIDVSPSYPARQIIWSDLPLSGP